MIVNLVVYIGFQEILMRLIFELITEWSFSLLFIDKDIKTNGFEKEACRSMINLLDVSFHFSTSKYAFIFITLRISPLQKLYCSAKILHIALTWSVQTTGKGRLGLRDFHVLWEKIKQYLVSNYYSLYENSNRFSILY